MSTIRSYGIGAACCAVVLLAGCKGLGTRRQYKPRPMPPGVAGTVMSQADLVGANPLLVRGYGLVVGLGHNGSSEVPPTLRKYLSQEMLKNKVGSRLAGTAGLKPGRMLDDKDTAVVVVAGWIPPGAPKGVRFDVLVEALPQTQTLSLVGGTLMTTKLHMALNSPAAVVGKAKTWAVCRGDVFVNPFITEQENPAPVKLRAGRILNGAVVTADRPMRLELRRPDYRLATIIERRINQRFGGGERIAKAKSPAIIELRVPPDWRDDYEHFLALVTHMYIGGGGAEEERHARELTKKIALPTARPADISLVWESMGRQVLPIVQPLYGSRHPTTAYFAARAGLRLGDNLAVEPMMHAARQAVSPFQVSAVRELGKARQFVQPVAMLRRLLSSRDDMLRVAAYEALVDHGSASSVTRRTISDRFVMDIVESERDYAIYATRAGRPKIVLFGRGIVVRRPVFYSPPDELVTINAGASDEKITLWRKIPRTRQTSDALRIAPRADAMVELLGSLPVVGPRGEIKGLGLTYSQVVGVMHDLCKKDHIPARFVLQRPPEMQKIYMLTPAVGRPDMPDEDEDIR